MVSVIVPVYNVEKYVRQCLESLKAQTLEDVEFVIIDDGSTDSSGRICDEYSIDSRFRVFHTENRGLSAARNRGLDEARGEWIEFVDSDDWVLPGFCEVPLKAAIENNADLVIFQRAPTNEKGRIKRGKKKEIPIGASIVNTAFNGVPGAEELFVAEPEAVEEVPAEGENSAEGDPADAVVTTEEVASNTTVEETVDEPVVEEPTAEEPAVEETIIEESVDEEVANSIIDENIDIISIEVANTALGAEITTQPVNAEGNVGDEVSFTVVAENAVSYQWQYYNGTKWVNSSGTAAKGATFTFTPSTEDARTTQRRCAIKGEDGVTIYTDAVWVVDPVYEDFRLEQPGHHIHD